MPPLITAFADCDSSLNMVRCGWTLKPTASAVDRGRQLGGIMVAEGRGRRRIGSMRILSPSFLLLMALAGSASAQLREFGVSVTPILTIGNNEGDESTSFASVDGTTRLPDGRIVVGDRGAYSIHIFSPQGKLVKQLGRSGSGPGEMLYLASFYRCGDEIFAYDIKNGYRMTLFSLDLAYKREFRFGGPKGGPPYATACNANQKFIQVGWENHSEMKAGVFRTDVDFWLSRADDKVELTLGKFPGSERWGMPGGTRPLPFGKQPVVAIGATRAYIGTADNSDIMVFDLAGKRVGLLQDNSPAVPVTTEDVEKEIALTPGNNSAATQKRLALAYAEMKLPKTMPAYGAFVVDALDNLWVQSYKRATARQVRWTVYAPDGKLLARVQLPTDLTVHEIGRDYILGRYQDVDEAIPQVRLYRLTR